MRIAVVSDTHMPRGRRRIPDACVEAMRSAELILHAGDLSSIEVLEWFEGLGPPVHAVHGNVDSEEVRARLPESDLVTAGRARIGLVHDAGPAKGRLKRLRRRFADADAVVFGHSHLPLHEREEGFEIFNPGSPTERRRAPRASYGLLDIEPGRMHFRHVWLT